MHRKKSQGATESRPAEPYPGFNKELREKRVKEERARERSMDTLPGPLAEAFAPREKPKSPAVEVRKFVHYDFVLLKALNSPLHRRLLELGKPAKKRKNIAFTDEDEAEILFQFTRPCREVKATFEREGREQFRKIAVEAILFNEAEPLPPGFYELAFAQVMQNLAAAFGTQLSYETPPQEGVTSFPKPPAEIVSAGG